MLHHILHRIRVYGFQTAVIYGELLLALVAIPLGDEVAVQQYHFSQNAAVYAVPEGASNRTAEEWVPVELYRHRPGTPL